MRAIILLLVLFLIGCSEEKSNLSEIKASTKIENGEQIEIVQATPDLEAEARLAPVLDAINNNNFNLSSSCSAETQIYSKKGKIIIGSTECETKDINVYLGSAEIEFKVGACHNNEEPKDASFFAFGSDKVNSYYIVSDHEVRNQIFICK